LFGASCLVGWHGHEHLKQCRMELFAKFGINLLMLGVAVEQWHEWWRGCAVGSAAAGQLGAQLQQP